MNRVMLAAVVLAGAAALPSAAQELPPGPDIHFMGPRGNIERGVRCATARVSIEEQALVDRTVRSRAGQGRPGGITVPVVFHVISDGVEGDVPESMLDDQIRVLNGAFKRKGFSFVKKFTNRVVDNQWFEGCYANQNFKKELAVDPARTLNFYTCKPRGNILGYAYLPWSYEETNWHHGVVVLYSSLPGGTAAPYNEGDTGTHEVGHYLGLYHTFERGCNAPGDSVDDTPYEASPAFGCPVGRDTCSQAGLDPIKNFMDYTDDPCMDEFTADQAARMQTIVATYKPSLGN